MDGARTKVAQAMEIRFHNEEGSVMRVLLISMGSAGDLLPFVALGQALRSRGHDVTVLSNGYFRDVVEKERLRFVEVSPADEHVKRTRQRSGWGFRRSFTEGGRNLLEDMPIVYEAVAAHYVPGETVAAAAGLMFGARIAQEKLGVPLATVHLSPLCFRSVHDDVAWPRWMPLPVRQLLFGMLERGIDRLFGTAINAFRSRLGLPPAVRILSDWWNSPQLVLGLFPDWLSHPRRDWPANTLLTGPPLYDAMRPFTRQRELEAFLYAGGPPLVFSHSSAIDDSRNFFANSVAVARSLGCPAVLLAPHGESVPQPLPAGVCHFPYVPHSLLLPRAAALVHHGGIGTALQALAAGIPQLIVPVFLDQPDNGRRLERLGVAATVRRAAYRSRVVSRKLEHLLGSTEVAERCREYAGRCRESNALQKACVALERLFERSGGTTEAPEGVRRLPALATG
jgi:UDP:flavonoid glycosyltransferase YjiC (YdhE family)